MRKYYFGIPEYTHQIKIQEVLVNRHEKKTKSFRIFVKKYTMNRLLGVIKRLVNEYTDDRIVFENEKRSHQICLTDIKAKTMISFSIKREGYSAEQISNFLYEKLHNYRRRDDLCDKQ